MTLLALHEDNAVARAVVAAPEAIAVVTRWNNTAVPTVFVIATRGAWLAEHVIAGESQRFAVGDADHAALLLLDRSGFRELHHDSPAVIDVTVAAYRRCVELVGDHDLPRARAALLADGARDAEATALVDAIAAGRVEVSGLCAEGTRFVGCDLAVVGDGTTGRFLVPVSNHVARSARGGPFAHAEPSGLRVYVERVGTDVLRDELALIFGDA